MPFSFQPTMGQDAVGPYSTPGGGGGGAGGGSSSGDGTYYAPPPGSVQGAEDYSTANLAYQRALARFNQQRTGLLQQYGYKGSIDPKTGLMTNIGVDAGNSYGQLQQLLHSQANEDQQAQYAAEDRGLHGGLANQGEQELSYAHHGQSSALAQSLFGGLSDLNGQQQDAHDTLDQALWQLQHGATTDAIGGGDFNPADLGGTDGGDGGGAGGGRGTKGRTVGTPSQIDVASKAAFKKAGGKSTPAAALAARSAGMNAAYGLAKAAAAKKAASKKPAPYRGRH